MLAVKQHSSLFSHINYNKRCFITLAFEANAATGADEKCFLTKNSKYDVYTQPRKLKLLKTMKQHFFEKLK